MAIDSVVQEDPNPINPDFKRYDTLWRRQKRILGPRIYEAYLEFILGFDKEVVKTHFSPQQDQRINKEEVLKRIRGKVPVIDNRLGFWRRVAELTPGVYSQEDIDFLATSDQMPEMYMCFAAGADYFPYYK